MDQLRYVRFIAVPIGTWTLMGLYIISSA